VFELLDVKLFRDVIHGYIKVPNCIVDNIIDTAMFQRLRNIEQTGMRVLYPDAKHDRFGHSLGVFHLGCLAVDALLSNFHESSEINRSKHWYVRSDDSLNAFWAKNKVLFLIACILHDIGHAPFSHSLESEMHRNNNKNGFDKQLASNLGVTEQELLQTRAAPHEKIGAMLILQQYREPIKRILDSLTLEHYPRRHQSALVIEPETASSYVNSDDLENDLQFVARMVLGLKYSAFQPEQQMKNCFIELLNGNIFDVDKLDYIMRDTQVSGVKNVTIDSERLLGAINIIALTQYRIEKVKTELFNDKTLIQHIVSDSSLSQDSSLPQLSIYGYFDGTLTIEKGAQVEIWGGCVIKELNVIGDDTLLVRNSSPHFCDVNDNSIMVVNGAVMDHERGNYRQIICKFQDTFTCLIRNMKIENENFIFTVKEGALSLSFKDFTRFHISGAFKNQAPLVIDAGIDRSASIDATNVSLAIVGDRLQDIVPAENIFNTFSVGFHKSAIGNISAVLDARDNLYKWIYAHHKVMYYANFLIPVIAQSLLGGRIICPFKGKIPIDDSIVWAEIKKKYKPENTDSDNDVDRLIVELVERRYKRSLFKSLAEYDAQFETFNDQIKTTMYNTFKENIEDNGEKPMPVYYEKFLDSNNMIMNTPKKEITAGFVKQSFIDELYCYEPSDIANVVWLAAQYKKKNIDLSSTYVLFKNSVTTLSRIDLLCNSMNITSNNTSHYFYLYFDIKNIDGEEETVRKQREAFARKRLLDAILSFFSRKAKNTV